MKLFKALSVIAAAGALFALASCKCGPSKFNSADFHGDWTIGTWKVTNDNNLQGVETHEEFTVTIKTGDLEEEVVMSKEGEEDNTAPLSEFVTFILEQTEKILPDEEELSNLKERNIPVTGKPYLEINCDKTEISADFSTQPEPETKIYLNLKVSKNK